MVTRKERAVRRRQRSDRRIGRVGLAVAVVAAVIAAVSIFSAWWLQTPKVAASLSIPIVTDAMLRDPLGGEVGMPAPVIVGYIIVNQGSVPVEIRGIEQLSTDGWVDLPFELHAQHAAADLNTPASIPPYASAMLISIAFTADRLCATPSDGCGALRVQRSEGDLEIPFPTGNECEPSSRTDCERLARTMLDTLQTGKWSQEACLRSYELGVAAGIAPSNVPLLCPVDGPAGAGAYSAPGL